MAEAAKIKRTRQANLGVITRSQTQLEQVLKKVPKDWTNDELHAVEGFLDLLKAKQRLIDDYNAQMIELLENDDELEAEIDSQSKIEANIRQQIAKLTALLDDAAVDTVPDDVISIHSSGSNNNPSINLKLPKIDLPKFSGNYKEWMPFIDLFTGSVDHNTSLSKPQKLQYLKSSLKGEPAKLIANLQTTEANYDCALKILKDRYENKKLIARAHLTSLFKLSSVKSDSPQELRRLMDNFVENSMALNALGIKEENFLDQIWIFLLSDKLDTESRRQWELSEAANDEEINFDRFKQFVDKRASALEAAQNNLSAKSSERSLRDRQSSSGQVQSYQSTPAACPKCRSQHRLHECEQFKELTVQQRRDLVKSSKLCFNCLRPGHTSKDCKSKSTCRRCEKRHHTFLHTDGSTPGPEKSQCNHSAKWGCTFCTLLPTALVDVHLPDNTKTSCRVLLDSGSESSFISEHFVQRLGLTKQKRDLKLTGIGQVKRNHKSALVSFQIQSRINDSKVNIEAFVLPKITAPMQGVTVSSLLRPPLCAQPLADADYHKWRPVDVLIGSDYFEEIVLDGKIKDQSGLYFRNTIFGWVVSGKVCQNQPRKTNVVNSFPTTVDSQLRQFWEIEEVPQHKTASQAESMCEDHFQQTTTISPEGRFVVKLPFKPEAQKLGDSYNQALRRFHSLERRLSKQPEIYKQYREFIDELLQLKHLEPVPASEYDKPAHETFFLPHHCVFKESTTTKLRVVFDGSAKTESGTSLNECLLVGPTIQPELFSTLIRFRLPLIALSADVAKMYRQIELHKEDRDFQRILWRNSSEEPIQQYRLTRVIYGIASSAFHAVRCLHEIGERCGGALFTTSIQRDFYVDDYLSGANSIDEAMALAQGVSEELQRYGFPLRKWVSSHSEITLSLPESIRESNDNSKILSPDYKIKTLGVLWKPNQDCFQFTCSLPDVSANTKRALLSDTAKLFDPFGWLAPVIIKFKCLLQEIWIRGSAWDDVLPDDILDKWKQMRTCLPLLNELAIPRCARTPSRLKTFELHLFCDASEVAYAAVVYSRVEDEDGNVVVRLLASKTRVAPVKTISVPRLELSAAHLGVKLLKALMQTLEHSIQCPLTFVAWTDSTIVLQWLSKLPRNWTTFVGNRTSQIQDVVPREYWKHVPSTFNPADCASRGQLTDEFLHNSLWWNGPEWLAMGSDTWPIQLPILIEAPEAKITKTNVIQTLSHSSQTSSKLSGSDLADTTLLDISRFSKLWRLLHTVVLVLTAKQKLLQFIRSSDASNNQEVATQSNSDRSQLLQKAKYYLVSQIQKAHFSSEFHLLSTGQSLDKTSRLLNLCPFFDAEHDIIRVGGRLGQSHFSVDKRFPALLPRDSYFTTLVVRHFHEATLHGGTDMTLNSLREEYWIIAGKGLVSRFIHKCVKCARFCTKEASQLMADLPAERVTPAKSFSSTGLDFAGPIITKPDNKTYIALFVCFVTKAIHLELVSSLTKEACLGAIIRFVSRRGIPKKMFSDNATNFIGARSDLLRLQAVFDKDSTNSIISDVEKRGIEWTTIPPRAPHFGGLWEANIKRMKHHLRRVVGIQILGYEELLSLVTEIEGILNSRPLTPQSSDPNDLRPLTPAHFLVGGPLTSLNAGQAEGTHTLGQRFRLLSSLTLHFWRRWKRDYLVHLQIRKRWLKDGPQFKEGELVLLAEDNLPPMNWKLGRIQRLFEGNDDISRVAKVKISTGEFMRPIIKLRKLPIPFES